MAALLVACFPAAAWGAPIEEAVRKGLAINPEVRAAQSDAKAADTDVEIAKGGYYPSVSVSGGPRSIDLDGVAYDVTAAQMLYDWGRVGSTVDSARAARRKLDQQALVKIDEAALDIVETYLDILVTERQIDALNAHIRRLDEIKDMTEARSEGGYADRSEAERADLEMARAWEQLAVEQGALRDARSQYRLLVGDEADGLEEPSPASVPGYVARSDLTAIILDSPVYRRALEDTKSAQASLKEARSSLLPQLNLEASTVRRDIGGRAENDSVIALRFRMNNLQGFSNFLRPKGARQRVESAQWNEAAVQRETRRQVQNLFDSADMMRWREEALRRQIKTSDEVGGTYLEQFKVGRRDVIDLLSVQRERFDADRQLISLHIDELRVQYRAAAKLGLIGPLLENGLR
ncbi:TolC family protein [Sphingobium boeckii]|uniref:Adhesin transport system outer membrane protein n=1 Tax=Sphingobium boeckii TaxID=1082345 RepID=A0A7W9ALM6_9SPHN|nr:adhesin transport system outer membrane protein [Sphingobium boeckii]